MLGQVLPRRRLRSLNHRLGRETHRAQKFNPQTASRRPGSLEVYSQFAQLLRARDPNLNSH
jgi:hypothetical protein